MEYVIKVYKGYISGSFIESALKHKQKIVDIIAICYEDDFGCDTLEHLEVRLESKSIALTSYFLSKFHITPVNSLENTYEEKR